MKLDLCLFINTLKVIYKFEKKELKNKAFTSKITDFKFDLKYDTKKVEITNHA